MARKSTKKPKAPRTWLDFFMELRDKLQPSVANSVKLYHAVFLSGRSGTRGFSHIIKTLDPAFEVIRKKPLLHIPVDAGDGVWAHHCLFGKNDTGIQKLCEELRGLSHWLTLAVEEKKLPRFDRVTLKGNPEANIIRWLGVLYFLAWKYQDPNLWAELEYSDSDVDLPQYFRLWDECGAAEQCDPRPFITSTVLQDRQLALWSPIHKPSGPKWPELVTAYLTTDVLQASMTAAMILKYYSVRPLPRRETKDQDGKRRGKPSERPELGEWTDADLLIIEVLAHHYCCFKDKITTEYINTVQIAQKCSEKRRADDKHAKLMSPGTVSKRMPKIFPGGLRKYDELCGGDDKMTAPKIRIKKYLEAMRERELGRIREKQASQIGTEDSSTSIFDSGQARRLGEERPSKFRRIGGRMESADSDFESDE